MTLFVFPPQAHIPLFDYRGDPHGAPGLGGSVIRFPYFHSYHVYILRRILAVENVLSLSVSLLFMNIHTTVSVPSN